MLTRHALNTHVGPDDHHGVVGNTARHAVDSGFDVFFVPGEVDEGDDFRAVPHDLRARQLVDIAVVDHAPVGTKPHYMLRDTRRPPGFKFVPMPEHCRPCQSAPVVQLP